MSAPSDPSLIPSRPPPPPPPPDAAPVHDPREDETKPDPEAPTPRAPGHAPSQRDTGRFRVIRKPTPPEGSAVVIKDRGREASCIYAFASAGYLGCEIIST